MSRIISLSEAQALPPGQLKDWAYNALDITGTREVHDALFPRLDSLTARTYAFERAVQGPALTMMRRGILVDTEARKAAVKALKADQRKLIKTLASMPKIKKVWDRYEKVTGACKKATRKDGKHKWEKGVPDTPNRKCVDCGRSRMKLTVFNPGSSHDKNHLFYDLFGLKPIKNKTGVVSTDDDVLEKIGAKFPEHYPITSAIREVQGYTKQIGFLNAKLGPDGRFYSTFNVGAAWTGRFSSSKNPFGLGGNAQNIAERARSMFMADPGYDICYADLEQAESRVVAYLSGDEEYIEAHKSGDVHTYVCRLIWPELPWTGNLKEDKKIASANPPWDTAPGHSWRFQAKRIQHGSNYGLSPFGIAMIAHIPFAEAQRAYRMYFTAFPYIKQWHNRIRAIVHAGEPLINPLGRRIRLFGRPWDPHTFKQGLSFIPQSTVADIINLALWQVWKNLDPNLVQLLAQVHDALLFQFPRGKVEAVRQVLDFMTLPLDINGRTMVIPTEAAIGRNWGKKNTDPKKGPLNPFGLETFHA